MSPNRIVAILTPLVFAPAAGAISAWAADSFPGVDLSQERLTNIFIAGALVALAPALQWLHGWQKYEEREAKAEYEVQAAGAAAAAASVAEPVSEPDAEEEVEEEFEEVDDAQALQELEELEDADDLGEFDDFEELEEEDPIAAEEADGTRAGV